MRILFALLLSAVVLLPLVAYARISHQVSAPTSTPTSGKTDANNPPKDSAVQPATVATTRKYSRSSYDITPLAKATVAELAKKLSPEAYRITQNAGTEPAFCGTLLDNKKNGSYYCVVCGLPLFTSSHKFDSGSGWPSFFAPSDPDHVAAHEDNSHGMQRVEINCARCGSHLGHVFDDGPKPTGLRFCLNGAALVFHEKGAALPPDSQPIKTETAYFAGGCFWGVEHYFDLAPGVIAADSGYMQGSTDKPTYKDICSQDEMPASRKPADYKPHVEAVQVIFDPAVISYAQLLEGFFEMHDPTTLNRQGPDYGTQYRSGLYTVGDAQTGEARKYVAELNVRNLFGGRKVVTEIEPAKTFFAAEDYHQDYLDKNPGRGCHIGKPWWITKKTPLSAGPSAKLETTPISPSK
jgi:peptide methionine sulfoxide reductase msrA/msrB